MLKIIESFPYCLTFLNERELINWRYTSKKANEAAICNTVFKPIFDRADFPIHFHSSDQLFYARWIKTRIIMKLNAPQERQRTQKVCVAVYHITTFMLAYNIVKESSSYIRLPYDQIHRITIYARASFILNDFFSMAAHIFFLISPVLNFLSDDNYENENWSKKIDIITASFNIFLYIAMSLGLLYKRPIHRYLHKTLPIRGVVLMTRGLIRYEKFQNYCERVGTQIRIATQIASHPTVGYRPRIRKAIKQCGLRERSVVIRLIDRVTCGCFGRIMRRFY